MTIKTRLTKLEKRTAQAPQYMTVTTFDQAHYWHVDRGIDYRNGFEDLDPNNPPEGATHYTRGDLARLEADRPGLQVIIISYTDQAPNMGAAVSDEKHHLHNQ